MRNAANPIDLPELGVIRKGVDAVNSFSHWPINNRLTALSQNWPFQHPRLVAKPLLEPGVFMPFLWRGRQFTVLKRLLEMDLPNLVRLSVPHYLRLQVEDAETAVWDSAVSRL